MEKVVNSVKGAIGVIPSPDDTNRIIRLAVQVQPYGYGKKGSNSLAARLAGATPENNFEIDENQPYGELWMGDHQNGPSRSAITGMDLHQLIQLSPEDFLGKSVLSKFKTVQLPFLFKILSFDKALPLQSHPNRKLGEQLMKQEKSESWLGKNETYVDPNHKPEVAVVLSEKFQGFVGFRPIEEIQDFVRDVPELRSAIGETMAEEFLALQPAEAEKKLKDTFGRIFDDEKSKGSHLVDSFIRRVKAEGNDAFGKARGSKEGDLAEVATKLYIHYPGDIGIFGALFFSNLVVLKRGEGIAIQPDVLHAYVEGDVIECMARSDNMLAHGFMSSMGIPPQDASLFVSNLLSEPGRSSRLELKYEVWSSRIRYNNIELYSIPMEEFDILHLTLKTGKDSEMIEGGFDGPSIWIVVKGTVEVEVDNGKQTERLSTGQIVFVKPGTGLKFTRVGNDDVEAWAAFCEG